MAPFTPFITESMYQHLRLFCTEESLAAAASASTNTGAAATPINKATQPGSAPSIHFTSVPLPRNDLANAGAEIRTALMQTVIELARTARERRTLSLKNPVKEVVVIHPDPTVLANVASLGNYITEEINALSLVTSTAEESWATLTAVPDAALLGKKLGKDFKAVAAAVKALSHADVVAFMSSGTMTVAGVTLASNEVKVVREVKTEKAAEGYEMLVSPDGSMIVALNVVQDESLRGMGSAREVVNRIQKLRKRLNLQVSTRGK